MKDANLGYGMSGGRRLHLGVDALRGEGRKTNAVTWWGDKQATVDYCKVNVPRICRQFGGDPKTSPSAVFRAARSAPATSGWPTTRLRHCGRACSPTTTSMVISGSGVIRGRPGVGIEASGPPEGRPVLVCGTEAGKYADDFLKDHLDLARFTFSMYRSPTSSKSPKARSSTRTPTYGCTVTVDTAAKPGPGCTMCSRSSCEGGLFSIPLAV